MNKKIKFFTDVYEETSVSSDLLVKFKMIIP
jgi:hypothetical protein